MAEDNRPQQNPAGKRPRKSGAPLRHGVGEIKRAARIASDIDRTTALVRESNPNKTSAGYIISAMHNFGRKEPFTEEELNVIAEFITKIFNKTPLGVVIDRKKEIIIKTGVNSSIVHCKSRSDFDIKVDFSDIIIDNKINYDKLILNGDYLFNSGGKTYQAFFRTTDIAVVRIEPKRELIGNTEHSPNTGDEQETAARTQLALLDFRASKAGMAEIFKRVSAQSELTDPELGYIGAVLAQAFEGEAAILAGKEINFARPIALTSSGGRAVINVVERGRKGFSSFELPSDISTSFSGSVVAGNLVSAGGKTFRIEAVNGSILVTSIDEIGGVKGLNKHQKAALARRRPDRPSSADENRSGLLVRAWLDKELVAALDREVNAQDSTRTAMLDEALRLYLRLKR